MEQITADSRPRAAIYARISSDKTGEKAGVDRQVGECRELATRLGWEVAATFVDNDVSAASGKPRPQYREMLAAVRSGRIDAILAWHTDRLHRRPTELEEFITLAESTGLKIQTVTAGDLDLSTPGGQMIARMLGAAARHEVDQTRKRIKSAKDDALKAGEYRGGPRPFGYESDGMTVRDSEAAMVREAVTQINATRSLRSIANEWNERGVRSTKGGAWSALTLREMVLRPRNAGIMARGLPGRRASKPGGALSHQYEYTELGTAKWPAIVDEDQWRAVVRVLTDSSRRDFEGTRERKHLGSAIYVCGGDGCGSLMRSGTHGGGRRHYRCRKGGQGHVMVLLEQTDRYVRETVAELIRDPRVLQALSPAAPDLSQDRARRVSLVARLGGFDADYKAGEITAAERRAFRSEVEAAIAGIDAKLAAVHRQAVSSEVVSALDPGAVFLTAPLDVQRAIVAATVRVTILPNHRRGAAWSTDRLRIEQIADADADDQRQDRAA